MTTYKTGNPLGSSAAKDLFDNAENLDFAVNSITQTIWIDRLGKPRKSWFGMESAFLAQLASQEDRFNAFIERSGYQVIGDYADGPLTVTEYNQLIRYDNELWKLTAAIDLPYTTAGNTEETWNATDSLHFVSVGDAALRQNLGSNEKGLGLSLAGLEQGGNAQQAILYITPQMFGAIGDYDPDTDTGSNDTLALKKAISVAITLGYRDVIVPSGFKYLVDEPLNLGGEGYYGHKGISLISDGLANAEIYFRVPDNNSACIEMLGGSGMSTARRVVGLTIQPTKNKRYTGVGLRLAGACFTKNRYLWIRQFGIGVHLLNDQPGVFTEQNLFEDVRFHRNLVDVLMEVNGGEDSLHGNDFKTCHFQVKTTVAGDDGNTTPGIALEMRGITRPAYWYNSYFDVHMFGGAGATAIKLTKANTDNIKGNVVAEGNLILKSTDAISSFESKGGFYSVGSVTMDVASEPTARLSTFIFENRQSNTANFSSPRLTGLSPRQLPLYAADRTDNGCAPFVFRLVGPNSDGLGYGTSGAPGSDHTFGYVPVGGNLQSFVPGLKLSGDGSSFSSYAPTLYISNATVGVQLAPRFFGPRVDNAIDFGAAGYRPKQYWGVNSSINTSDARHKTDPREPVEAEIEAFYEIGQLPWVWQWLIKYQSEGDGARLHSGPTVQAAIAIMEKYSLDWRNYSAFCFDKQDAQEEEIEMWDDYYVTVKGTRALYDEIGNCVQEAVPEHQELVLSAGNRVIKEAREAFEVYSFRKEELLLWILRATIEKQKNFEIRLSALEST